MSRPAAPLSESRLSVVLGALVALVAAVVFLPSVSGEFVYDDDALIVSNALIQDPRLVGTALTSDVFAYRSAAGEATSPYWRPTTMAWLIAMHRLFGLESAAGWHAGNIALHALVTALAFALMRRLGMGPLVAAAAALVFAVHPTRTENVAWVSGVPDLLVGAGMLGALLLALRARDAAKAWRRPLLWAAALGVYALALGAKEIAIVLPILLFFVLLPWGQRDEIDAAESGEAPRPLWSRARPALLASLPFAALAVVYLLIRHSIVGNAGATNPDAPGAAGAIKSAPLVGAFYLRQMLAPIWLGPTYPLRPVATPGLFNFAIPLAVCLAAAGGLLYLALGRPRSRAALVGLAILLLTAAPAAWAPAHAPELMVQDRYLYVPLLGLAMALAAGGQRLLARRTGEARAGTALFAVAAVAAVPLAAQTFRYTGAWSSNLALWTWAVQNDPDSRLPWAQWGNFLVEAEMYEEAAAALDRAIAIKPTPTSLLARANAARKMLDFDGAERFTNQALVDLRARNQGRDLLMATDLLARIMLERAESQHGPRLPDEALAPVLELYRDLRGRLPTFRVMVTDRMAAILMAQSDPATPKDPPSPRRDLALAELESVRADIPRDRAVESRMALYRLGQLYSERGRYKDALAAFEEFLALTEGTAHDITLVARDTAARAIPQLRRLAEQGS